MTLLEMLQAGQVTEFNARRGQRVTLDLFAADLSGLQLRDVDLSNANLEKADLSGSDLTGANLARANLCGADLTGARLDDCVAIKARMREAYLGQAHATGGEFAGADLSEADLSGFDGTRGRFAGARFKEAVLANAILVEADLAEARLSNADLRGADLSRAKLGQADLSRANASGACLEGADLKQARLAGAVLRNARLAAADLSGADLSGADLTGSDLTGANLDRADLFEVQAEEEVLKAAKLPAGFAAAPGAPDAVEIVELHIEDPSIATLDGSAGILWENAEADESFRLRAATSTAKRAFDGTTHSLAIPVDQVLSRNILAVGGKFVCALFVDRPAGVELLVSDLDPAAGFGAPRSVRLGYTPVVKPILVAEEDGFLLYGIGRQGALSVHRFDSNGLTEIMRAPANTYRGFCGRLDPILLGKGGTVAAVRRDGIGKLLTAPAGYPGRLTAAAYRSDGEQIALAWAAKAEKGMRFQVLGADAEPVRVDATFEIGSLDLIAVDERWLLTYTRESTRESDYTLPWAVWISGGSVGKPFPLLGGKDSVDVEDIRFVPGRPTRVGLVTIGEDLLILDVGESTASVVAKFGA